MARYEPPPFPVSDAFMMERRAELVSDTRAYLTREGPLNHRDVQRYARKVRDVSANLVGLLITAQRQYLDLCDAITSRQDALDVAADLLELADRRAASWNPFPFLRSRVVRDWPRLTWDHTAAAMLRAILRGVRSLLGLR